MNGDAAEDYRRMPTADREGLEELEESNRNMNRDDNAICECSTIYAKP